MRQPDATADLTALLERLAGSKIELVLVGALAAVAQGAPIATYDVDIVHRRTDENVERLLGLLGELGARPRPPSPPLEPSRERLLGPGHSLLSTKLGPLDILGAIEGGRTYEDLLPLSVVVAIDGEPLRVLSLAAIVELKQGSTEVKDKLRLPIYRAVLARRGSHPPE